jgi:hypothetical protein
VPPPLVRSDGDLGFDWDVVVRLRPEIDTPDPEWPSLLSDIRAGSRGARTPAASCRLRVGCAQRRRGCVGESGRGRPRGSRSPGHCPGGDTSCCPSYSWGSGCSSSSKAAHSGSDPRDVSPIGMRHIAAFLHG